MDWIFRIIVGVALLVVGLIVAVMTVLDAAAGDPDVGPLRGWGPVIAGLGVAVVGILILIF